MSSAIGVLWRIALAAHEINACKTEAAQAAYGVIAFLSSVGQTLAALISNPPNQRLLRN